MAQPPTGSASRTGRPMVDGLVLPPPDGAPATAALALLHGYGADAHDLAGLVPALAPRLPGILFLAPHAPFPCEGAPFGRQWFGLSDLDPRRLLEGARIAAPLLGAFLDAQLAAHGVPANRLVLAGFSQGALMALHVGLRRDPAPAGIVAWSGWLAGPETLAAERRGAPPVLLVHGTEDTVVPYQAMGLAEAALRAQGVPVETLSRPGLGHGIDQPALDRATAFIITVLAR